MGDKFKFEKLTPVRDADISVYKEAFDFIFENEDIKNVAVSGAYSAGKSSILESYKAKHTNLKFVHISLAQFRIPEQDDLESTDSGNNQTKEIIKESILEGKKKPRCQTLSYEALSYLVGQVIKDLAKKFVRFLHFQNKEFL